MTYTIVVGWTPNIFGRAALTAAAEQARLRSGGRLLVVNATRGDSYVDERYATGSELEGLHQELRELDVPADVHQAMGSDVGDLLIEAAEQADAAMIVLGIRHRTPVGKLLMGSVAQRVLLGARCPVLAVKPPEDG